MTDSPADLKHLEDPQILARFREWETLLLPVLGNETTRTILLRAFTIGYRCGAIDELRRAIDRETKG